MYNERIQRYISESTMKLKTLLEMPEYVERELAREEPAQREISVDAFDREFDLLDRIKYSDGTLAVYGLRKDRSAAIAGEVVTKDNRQYLSIKIHLSFHAAPQVGEIVGDALQVDLVQSAPETKSYGHGYNLYHAIIKSGITLISDNVQYIGGKKLWDKVIRKSKVDGFHIYVLRHGEFMRDAAGKVIEFDGINIPSNQIWGRPGSVDAHNTLLVATKQQF